MGYKINYREKYKHLFGPPINYGSDCTITDQITSMLDHFNTLTNHKFYADNRILIPGKNGYLPRTGIIIEHNGKNEDFEQDFKQYLPRIEQLAKKLEKYSAIYECSFKTEFCNIDNWVDFEGNKTGYNLSL